MSPLPTNYKGQDTYVRRVYLDEAAPQRDQRFAATLAATRPPEWPAIVIPETLDNCHASVRRTHTALSTRSGDPLKMVRSSGVNVFDVDVSQAQRDRALRILQACVSVLLTADATLAAGKSSESPLHLNVLDQFVGLRIDELMDKTLREPTAKEVADEKRYSWMKPDLRVYTPSGRLRLTVQTDNKYSNHFSIGDGVSRIEDRLSDFVERVWTKAVRKKVEGEIADEEHRRWQEEYARRAALKEARRKELERLELAEKIVRRWHRARLLREYAEALEASNGRAEKGASPAWLRNAAEWLDPLVAKRWPAVDIDCEDDEYGGEENDNEDDASAPEADNWTSGLS